MSKAKEQGEKLLQVTMTYERPDGTFYRRTITKDEVLKWKKMVDGICVLARVRGANPDWRSIVWSEEELHMPEASAI